MTSTIQNDEGVEARIREAVEADTYLDGIQVSHSDALLVLASLAREPATADVEQVRRAVDGALARYVRTCKKRRFDPAFSEVSNVVAPAIMDIINRAAWEGPAYEYGVTWDPESQHPDAAQSSEPAIAEGERAALQEALCWLQSVRVFVTSREKIHPCGADMHDELIAKLTALVGESTHG